MATEAAAIEQADPYEGLRRLTIKIMNILRLKLERLQRWTVMRQISGGQGSLWDLIARKFDELIAKFSWTNLASALRWDALIKFGEWIKDHIYTPFKDYLTNWKDAFLGWWNGAIDQLTTNFTAFKDSIVERWNQVWVWMKEHLTWLKDSILGWWNGAIERLRTVISNISAAIGPPITAAWQQITSHLHSLWDVFSGYFNRLREGIGTAMASLSAFLHNPLEGLRTLWARFQETWAGKLLLSIGQSLTTFWNSMVEAIRQWWATFQPKLMAAAERAITFARPYIERWVGAFKELPATFLNWVATTAGSNLALTPSRALTTVGSLYAMALAAGTTAKILATGLNLIPGTNWVGASALAAYVAEAAGFEPITQATYGTLLNEVLTWPLRYHWNIQLRPRIPTEGTIFLMGRKRGLNRGEFNQAMAYQGLPDWWIGKEYLFFWTDPSPYWLLRMSEAANPAIHPSSLFLPWLEEWLPNWRGDPWAWYKMKLMLAGFEDTDIPAFIEGFQKRMVSSAVTQVKTSVRAMLREGYWSREMAEGALRPMGVRQDEVELLLVAEELDYQKRYMDDQARYFKEAFRKGEIDQQDLTLTLSTIIVKPERVAQEVARERIRVLPKPKPLTQPKEDPLVTSLRRQAITSWTKQYRNWKIDEEDLLLGLTIVTQDPDLAGEMVAVERTRYRPPPPPPVPPKEDPLIAKSRRQAIASYVTAFRKGEIDADQLELYLVDLIPDVETRLQIVHLESLRYKPTPELIPLPSEDPELAKIRAERVRGHIAMFQKRLIGLEQLYTFLLADGLVGPLARATVITQANKRIKVPRLDSPYFLRDIMQELMDKGLLAYEEMFMKAQITIDQYTAWLISIGVDPDVVTYLADTLTLRKFLP